MFKSSAVTLVSTVLGIGAVVVMSNTAFAFDSAQSSCYKPGFYAGVEAGFDNTHYNATDVLSEARTANAQSILFNYPSAFLYGNVDDQGNGGRLFAGYQFTQFLALEAGYTQFHKTTSVGAGIIPISRSENVSIINPFYQYSGELTEHAADLVGKLTYPLGYGFGVFAKAGVAYIASDRYINITTIQYDGRAIPAGTLFAKSYQSVEPTYGAGINYCIPNTPLNISAAYTEIAGGGGISRASLISFGISDKFA
jgi:hypothetical protein